MNRRRSEAYINYVRKSILCITIGTSSGCILYQIFVHFNIAIFGWNLGLIFAPLLGGYVETALANKIIGENIGAVSSYLLFFITTFYSFILKNTALGLNLITIGSLIVILQAAFPTLVNYIIIVCGVGIISYILGIFKKISNYIYDKIEFIYYKYIIKKPQKVVIETVEIFDEKRSNEVINNLDFFFITSTDVDYEIINLGQFHATVILDKDKRLVHTEQEKVEATTLNNLKKAKDKCLIKLAKNIKSAGGNGVIDLEIEYGLIGLGGDSYQITTMGMGVYFK